MSEWVLQAFFGVFLLSGFGNGAVLYGAKRTLKSTKAVWKCETERQQTYKSISHSIRTSSKRAERHCNVSCNSGTDLSLLISLVVVLVVFFFFRLRSTDYRILVTFLTILESEFRYQKFHHIFRRILCSFGSSLVRNRYVDRAQCQLVSRTWYYTAFIREQTIERWILSCGWKIAMHTARLYGVSLVFASLANVCTIWIIVYVFCAGCYQTRVDNDVLVWNSQFSRMVTMYTKC